MKRTRIDLSLSQKVDVIERLDKKVPQCKIAKQFGVSQSQISRVATNKSFILSEWEQSGNPNRKRKRVGKDPEVESALKTWFTEIRDHDLPVTGSILKEKAKDLAETLNKPDFTPTTGWLSRWKERCSLSKKKPKKEIRVGVLGADRWVNEDIPELLDTYGPNDVYNASQTGIYFNAMPEGTYTVKNENTSNTDKETGHITALVACNMSGTDKRRLLVIGDRKIPRCVSGIPVDYVHSRHAWITGDIFRRWCIHLDRDMKDQKRKIVLMIDHRSALPVDTTAKLDHVKLIFIPSNAKQPSEQGFLSHLKCLYKKQIIHRIVAELNIGNNIEKNSCVTEITLLDAIHMLQKAWSKVPKNLIIGCYQKAGFRLAAGDEDVPVHVKETNVTAPDGISQEEFEKFMKVDENVEGFGMRADDEIYARMLNAKSACQADTNDGEENERARTTASDALKALVTVRRYLECHSVANFKSFYALETTVHSTIRKVATQKTKDG